MLHSDDMGRVKENNEETAKRNKKTPTQLQATGPWRMGVKPGSLRKNPDKQVKRTLKST